MTTSRISGGAGWWKSPCPDPARAPGRQRPGATRQRRIDVVIEPGKDENRVIDMGRKAKSPRS